MNLHLSAAAAPTWVLAALSLSYAPKSASAQTPCIGLVLNHLNVTSVDGVLGSPQFGQAYAADNGRRIEIGARYSF